jgi:hypothetical protein
MFHIFLDLIVIIQIIYYRRINSNLDLEESEYLLNNVIDYNYIEFTFLYLTKLEFIFVLSIYLIFYQNVHQCILMYNFLFYSPSRARFAQCF